MKLPWSITTTIRNPERLRNLLRVFKELEGETWDKDTQEKFQILLIQHRLYGYGRPQFYGDLSPEQVEIIDTTDFDISYEQAEDIFVSKDYTDPPMRGRQSANPLFKLGLAVLRNKKITITQTGELFLHDTYDYEKIFFRSFLKWQIPNPLSRDYPDDGNYAIKPFVGTLQLIKAVNELEIASGNKPKGISKAEFCLFVPTLVHFQDIQTYAEKIVELRNELSEIPSQEQQNYFNEYERQFVSDFLDSENDKEITKLQNNLYDYGDNAIRYFRLTRFIYIRGNGNYVDLEPRRAVEINELLAHDNAQPLSFSSKDEYSEYLADITKPQLPWETETKYKEIISNLIKDIESYSAAPDKENIEFRDYQNLDLDELGKYADELRSQRRSLQNAEILSKSQELTEIQACINSLEKIYDANNRPTLLEKLSTFGLLALNDAIKIHPNYPVGDDNEPTFTAPAGVPDIECFYASFNSICEVTMLKTRDQWINEGQPVMRHLRDFGDKHSDKPSYCLFIAPSLHRDTINTFWTAIKYEYEGEKQRIVPLTIKQFIVVLNVLVQMKTKQQFLKHSELLHLYDQIVNLKDSAKDSREWVKLIPSVINTWQDRLTSQSLI